MINHILNRFLRGGASSENSSVGSPSSSLIPCPSQVINNRRVMHETQMLLIGRGMANIVKAKDDIGSFQDVEFKVFSEWGDDGIIQWLVHHLDIPHKSFIEFGVQDYRESNTRFLMMNDNWSGFVLDGSENNIAAIINSEYYWRYDLAAEYAFIDSSNINDLISKRSFEKEVGILHIDIDGMDYWVWMAIDVISPLIVIVEYNSVFGSERAVTVPYDPLFERTKAHHSNLFFGASLRALHLLSQDKGYAFIGCNSAGNNAYFIRRDKLNSHVREVSVEEGFVLSKFRESRDLNGNLTHISNDNRIELIKGMTVFDAETRNLVLL